MFIRKCPKCNSEIKYKTKQSFNIAEKKNSFCKSCAQKIKMSIPGAKENISNKTKGKNNPMYGKSIYDVWFKKYGKLIADKKIKEWYSNIKVWPSKINDNRKNKSFEEIFGKQKAKEIKEKISKSTSGKNNGMYGKPSPEGSGNGWSGWYKEFYFRSLHELMFLITCKRFNLKIKSAEKKTYKIKYFEYDDTERNYFADYIINNKWLVEVKPTKLWNTPKNKLKFAAAKEWCKLNNLEFRVIDFGKIDRTVFKNLIETNEIKLNKRYKEKYEKYISN